MLRLLRHCFFLTRKWRSRCGEKGRWGDLGGLGQGEIMGVMYCIREDSIFKKNLKRYEEAMILGVRIIC